MTIIWTIAARIKATCVWFPNQRKLNTLTDTCRWMGIRSGNWHVVCGGTVTLLHCLFHSALPSLSVLHWSIRDPANIHCPVSQDYLTNPCYVFNCFYKFYAKISFQMQNFLSCIRRCLTVTVKYKIGWKRIQPTLLYISKICVTALRDILVNARRLLRFKECLLTTLKIFNLH